MRRSRNRRPRVFGDRRNAQAGKRPRPVLLVIAGDIALLGAALVVFALFHHVIPRELESIGTVSSRPVSVEAADVSAEAAAVEVAAPAMATAAPAMATLPAASADALPAAADAATETAVPAAGAPADAADVLPAAEDDAAAQTAASTAETAASTAETAASTAETAASTAETANAEAAPVGDFSAINAGMFTDGEVQQGQQGSQYVYVSENVRILNSTRNTDFGDGNVRYYVSEFYIRDIENLQTAFAKDRYGQGYREATAALAERKGALVAINGDYYGTRSEGVIMRNGTLYRQSMFGDICVLYWDGTMETYAVDEIDPEAIMARNPYQIWSFGPELLDENGQAMSEFNSSLNPRNPRTAIGYFAPGHYCFVVVDGRSSSSKGATLTQLSQLMCELGCVSAYNLDGGQTSMMVWKGTTVNKPAGGGRAGSDIIMVVE